MDVQDTSRPYQICESTSLECLDTVKVLRGSLSKSPSCPDLTPIEPRVSAALRSHYLDDRRVRPYAPFEDKLRPNIDFNHRRTFLRTSVSDPFCFIPRGCATTGC